MTKQLKTIEILSPSKSATCSMWRYPESAKIFQYRGMDFDVFRVVRVNEQYKSFKIQQLPLLSRKLGLMKLNYFVRTLILKLLYLREFVF